MLFCYFPGDIHLEACYFKIRYAFPGKIIFQQGMQFVIFIVNNAVGFDIKQMIVPMCFGIEPVNVFTGIYTFHQACFSETIKCFIYCTQGDAWVLDLYCIINFFSRRVPFIGKEAGVYHYPLLRDFQACFGELFLYFLRGMFRFCYNIFIF